MIRKKQGSKIAWNGPGHSGRPGKASPRKITELASGLELNVESGSGREECPSEVGRPSPTSGS